MLDVLQQILCWIKQIGAMMLTALIDMVNGLIIGLAAIVQASFDAWPIHMPDLPTVPAQLLAAWGWVRWTPLPIDAGAALLLFMLGTWIIWFAASVLLRWVKVVND